MAKLIERNESGLPHDSEVVVKYLIQHFIEETLRDCPERPAIKQGEQQYTYGQIDKLSNRYANYFLKHPPRGGIFGILSRVRAEAVVAMIGALRAGLVYVPMNTLAPVAWLGNVVAGAQIEVLLVDSEFLEHARSLQQYGIKTIICIDEHNRPLPADCPALKDIMAYPSDFSKETAPNILADDLAYILYTSGSTGSPKGIMITHRNACTFIDWMMKEFKLTPQDRVFNRAPLQFDLSVFDIFSTFAAGAQLVIAPMGFSKNAHDVVTLMEEEQVTVVYAVPSTFINWMAKGELERGISSLRLVLYAGEPFPVPYLRKFKECLPNVQIYNIYGPTETNIVTYFQIERIPDEWDSVPIGKPVHDTQIYIVDDELKPVPQGEKGEILVRGGTVFAGYFNDPERTREKLVQSPFHSYQTLACRTGDLGRFLPDGNIVYHGRADNLIKTRGYRVEIGEVETALSSIAGIDELAVIAKPHEKYGNTLHAFVLSRTGGPSVESIAAQLAERIPGYMMPCEIIRLDGLPKTATGKVDRVELKQRLLSEGIKSEGCV